MLILAGDLKNETDGETLHIATHLPLFITGLGCVLYVYAILRCIERARPRFDEAKLHNTSEIHDELTRTSKF